MQKNTATLDFGTFPGKTDTSLFISDPTIVAGALADAWIVPVASADHSVDEHRVDPPRVMAGNVVAGSGFTIYGFSRSTTMSLLSEAALVYGQWTVAWAWNYSPFVSRAPAINKVAPTLSGTTTSGSVLTASTGTWIGTPTITYAYQWYRNGVLASGQTASTYTITDSVGVVLTCQVTGTNTYGSQTVSSDSKTVTPVSVGVTSVLFNFQGANGLVEQTGKNLLNNGIIIDQSNYAPGAGYPSTFLDNEYLGDTVSRADWAPGTGDFCIEADVQAINPPFITDVPFMSTTENGRAEGMAMTLHPETSVGAFDSGFRFIVNGTVLLGYTPAVSLIGDGSFHRLCVLRNSGVISMFIDGGLVASNPFSANITDPFGFCLWNWEASAPDAIPWQGLIRAFRYTNGASRYSATGDHTPDSLPFTV